MTPNYRLLIQIIKRKQCEKDANGLHKREPVVSKLDIQILASRSYPFVSVPLFIIAMKKFSFSVNSLVFLCLLVSTLLLVSHQDAEAFGAHPVNVGGREIRRTSEVNIPFQ